MERGISPLSDCIALVRLWLLLRRLRPDIVEFSTPKAGFLGTIAARVCGVSARIYLLRGLRMETSTGLRRILMLRAERLAARSAEVVVCNSRSLLESALTHGVAQATKLRVLGKGSSNGVDIERFSPGSSEVREQLGIPSTAPVVGFVGRLTIDKGVPELLEAFALLLHEKPDAYLVLVGWFDASDDALGWRLRERIESHPRIFCTGFVGNPEAYYRVMDVMVLPSRREGFPNVILEAAACGLPVIAANCTGSRDAVAHEVTGLLISPGDPIAICDAMRRILADAALRLRMSRAARTWVDENYQSSRVFGLTVAYYKSLVQSATEEDEMALGSSRKSVTGLPASL